MARRDRLFLSRRHHDTRLRDLRGALEGEQHGQADDGAQDGVGIPGDVAPYGARAERYEQRGTGGRHAAKVLKPCHEDGLGEAVVGRRTWQGDVAGARGGKGEQGEKTACIPTREIEITQAETTTIARAVMPCARSIAKITAHAGQIHIAWASHPRQEMWCSTWENAQAERAVRAGYKGANRTWQRHRRHAHTCSRGRRTNGHTP